MDVLKVDFNSASAPALFTRSLHETGFAVLTHHPIKKEWVEAIYQEWRDFFASEDKHAYLFDVDNQDGYFPEKIAETAKGHTIKDLKEFYHFYDWGRIPTSISSLTLQFYYELADLAATLLQWVEDNLPNDIAAQLSLPLSDMIKNSQRTLLRIINYPPLSGSEPIGALRAAAHEDINLLTLLPAATAPGLQVLDKTGRWHDVPADHGSLVINAGDMLQMCTQGYYRSTTHRVTNPAGIEARQPRLSMPLFLHPQDDVKLSPTHTANGYRLERLRELGLVPAKDR